MIAPDCWWRLCHAVLRLSGLSWLGRACDVVLQRPVLQEYLWLPLMLWLPEMLEGRASEPAGK